MDLCSTATPPDSPLTMQNVVSSPKHRDLSAAKVRVGAWTTAVFAALVVMATEGCAKRESRVDASTSGRADSTRIVQVDSTRLEPSQIEEVPVGASDSLILAIAPRIEPWVVMWRQAMPEFRPDSLIRVGVAPAFRGYVQPLKAMYPPSEEKKATFQILTASSPDGRYNLIFDSYLIIEQDAGEIDISGEPDSAPLLLDLLQGVSNQFEFCGTDCKFHWGVWLSPKRFVLAGSQYDDPPGVLRGKVQIFSLDDSSVTTYVTRGAPPSRAGEYRLAWRTWVVSRFRALKNSKP